MTDRYKKLLKGVTDRLKKTRERYHITQKEIADRMELSQSAISLFECGKIDSYIMILKYEECLGQFIEEKDNA